MGRSFIVATSELSESETGHKRRDLTLANLNTLPNQPITAQSIWSLAHEKSEGLLPLKYAILNFGKCLNY